MSWNLVNWRVWPHFCMNLNRMETLLRAFIAYSKCSFLSKRFKNCLQFCKPTLWWLKVNIRQYRPSPNKVNLINNIPQLSHLTNPKSLCGKQSNILRCSNVLMLSTSYKSWSTYLQDSRTRKKCRLRWQESLHKALKSRLCTKIRAGQLIRETKVKLCKKLKKSKGSLHREQQAFWDQEAVRVEERVIIEEVEQLNRWIKTEKSQFTENFTYWRIILFLSW